MNFVLPIKFDFEFQTLKDHKLGKINYRACRSETSILATDNIYIFRESLFI